MPRPAASPPPAPVERIEPPPENAPPAWTYWEPVEVPLFAAAPYAGTSSEAGTSGAGSPAPASDLPLDPAQLVRTPSAETRWASAAPSLRDAITTHGFAVSRTAHPHTRLGEFYAALREDAVPWVLTLDALFFLTHVAIGRALGEVDAATMRPSLATLLHRLDIRLAAESRTARADMVQPYIVSRGLVGVALALSERTYQPAAELAALVGAETARVVAHTGVGVSPWLQTSLDYSALSLRGMADHDEASAGWFRAASWLELAGLSLEGAGERGGLVAVDVATARTHTRAALLMTRLVEADSDAEVVTAWDRLARAGELVIGEVDDVTPRDVMAAVANASFDLQNPAWFASVRRVDRVRHAAALGAASRVYDGTGGAWAPAKSGERGESSHVVARTFRLLGPCATPDSEVLQSLVFPSIGPLESVASLARGPAPTRIFPSALDVAAWLGSASARAALHQTSDDAFERYSETLDRLVRARAPQGPLARHRTPYLSMIDAIETWISPSAGDRFEPGTATEQWHRRKADVALAAWTELRHDATSFTRAPVADVRLPPRIPGQTSVPVFVEAHPEAIAKLIAVVRQTSRALVGEGDLPSTAPALTILEEVDDILWTAFGAAVYETADETVPPGVAAALAGLPARLGALEAVLAEAGEADVPLAADVHTDLPSGRTLEEATGRIEEAWMVVREPGTHWLWLAIGASIPHYELVQPSAQRWTDGAWRARLESEGDPPPGVLARSYEANRRLLDPGTADR
ncbi:MAG: DUF3160 domain-containing protein [Myxococcota bacterium]|nr:DUF3160 domain-containing protein [Myxococcota bacterium]